MFPLRSLCLSEQNLRKVSQVQALIESSWYFIFLKICLSNCSQNNYDEYCKFQLRFSEYFGGKYRTICPFQVIGQMMKRFHHKEF